MLNVWGTGEVRRGFWLENLREDITWKIYMRTKMNLKEIGCKGMDWTTLVQDREKLWLDTNMAVNTRFA
jgi:hypothetical protein